MEFETHRKRDFPGWVFVVVGSALPVEIGEQPLGWALHVLGFPPLTVPLSYTGVSEQSIN